MRLRFAHRILILAAMALGAMLLAYGIGRYHRHGDTAALATGIGGALAALALGFYLRWFLKKGAPKGP